MSAAKIVPDHPPSSAPAFTPREEEEEWAATPPHEIVEIESDLHGLHLAHPCPVPSISPDPEWEEEAERAGLPDLQRELDRIPDGDKWALLQAEKKCPDLANDEKLRRAFLWKEDMDAKTAAKKFAAYWEYRLRLFGPDRAFLPITLSGALSDDYVALSEGFLQMMPEKDTHGRLVLFSDISRHDVSKYSRESMIRVCWYLFHVAIESDVDRRAGIVFIIFPKTATSSQFDYGLYRSFADIGTNYLPIRCRSLHICHPYFLSHIVAPVFKFVIGERLRKRLKMHYGTVEGVLQNLEDFGLPRNRVPVALGGEVKIDPVKWLSNRMIREGMGRISCPGSTSTFGGQSALSGVEPAPLPVDASLLSSLADSPTEKGQANTATKPSDLNAGHGDSLDPDDLMQWLEQSGFAGNEMEAETPPSASDGECSWPHNTSTANIAQHCLPNTACSGTLRPDYVETAMEVKRAKNRQRAAQCNVSLSAVDTLPGARDSARKQNESKRKSTPSKKKKGGGAVRKNAAPPKRRGDPRMNRAVDLKLADPQLSLLDALLGGGFDFPDAGKEDVADQEIKDGNGVSLYQRKNQLSRRLRESRRDDPRMTKAVAAAAGDPNLTPLEALTLGGYRFPPSEAPDLCDRTLRDDENVSFFSRKNELKKRLAAARGGGGGGGGLKSPSAAPPGWQDNATTAALTKMRMNLFKAQSISEMPVSRLKGIEEPHDATTPCITRNESADTGENTLDIGSWMWGSNEGAQ